MPDNDAIVVFSGGQDSTTCLFWALEKFDSVRAITFDYGQKHLIELECAANICATFNIEQDVVPVSSLNSLGGNSLTDSSIQIDKQVKNGILPNTFVAGRNIIFFSLAAAKAYQLNIQNLVTGVGQADYSGYPDCREDFVKSMEKTIALGMEFDLKIHRPLMLKEKHEIWELSNQLGRLEEVVKMTHTCYQGERTMLNEWGYGCGDCPACVLRKKGFYRFMEIKNALQT